MSDKIWAAAAAERRDIKRHSLSLHCSHTVTVHKKMCVFGFWRKGQALPSGRTRVYNSGSRRTLRTRIHVTGTGCYGCRKTWQWGALGSPAESCGWGLAKHTEQQQRVQKPSGRGSAPAPYLSQPWSLCCSCILQWGWAWHRRDAATQEELWNSLFLSPFSCSPAAGLSLVAQLATNGWQTGNPWLPKATTPPATCSALGLEQGCCFLSLSPLAPFTPPHTESCQPCPHPLTFS